MSFIKYFRPPKVSRLAWKVWLRNKDVFAKTYRVSFIPPFLEPLLYLFAFGFGLGFFITTINFDGLTVSYREFLAPALISISIMNSGFFECSYNSFVRMHYQKTYDAIISTPLNIEDVITGELLWGATRSMINAGIIILVVSAFGLVDLTLVLLVIPLSFLGGLLFSAMGMLFSAITPNIESLNYPVFLLVTPMLLFSGTFFPLSILPGAFQALAFIFPMTHLVGITRGITLNSVGMPQFYSLVWVLVATILLTILSINLMKRRLIQ